MLQKISNLNLKNQFILIILPTIILASGVTALFFIYLYSNLLVLQDLKKDIEFTEDIRKLIVQIGKERDNSILFLLKKDRRTTRILNRDRHMIHTRIKSINRKLESINGKLATNIKLHLKQMENRLSAIRNEIDKNIVKTDRVSLIYSNEISQLVEFISSISDTVEKTSISRNILAYALYIKYIDLEKQKNRTIQNLFQNSSSVFEKRLIGISASQKTLIETIYRIIDMDIRDNLDAILNSKEVQILDNIELSNLEKIRDRFREIVSKRERKLREIQDYISRHILTSINLEIEDKNRTIYIVGLVLLIFFIAILGIAYIIYEMLRNLLFFGVLKIRGTISRTVSEWNLDFTSNSKNEITQTIDLITQFSNLVIIIIKTIRMQFNRLAVISNKIIKASENITEHVQKQDDFVRDINEQLIIFLENIRNSEISFQNLKEIIESSSAKLDNLNMNIVYISYEILSIEDIFYKVTDGENRIKEILSNHIERHKDILENDKDLQEAISIIQKQMTILENQQKKLGELKNSANVIKQDIQLNSANLNDILGVITILGYETKNIVSDISRNIKDNEDLLDESSRILEEQKSTAENIDRMNREILSLDREFNKFRF